MFTTAYFILYLPFCPGINTCLNEKRKYSAGHISPFTKGFMSGNNKCGLNELMEVKKGQIFTFNSLWHRPYGQYY